MLHLLTGVSICLLAGFLALLTAFLYVLVYTPLKRISWLNTFIGAVPGALPPLGGWVAASGELGLGGWFAAWQGYYEIDPYWGIMPDWYAGVMNAQDYLYNPFWALALVMFLRGRQDTPWFRTAMIVVATATMTTTMRMIMIIPIRLWITGNMEYFEELTQPSGYTNTLSSHRS